jgi:hypothetical protein
MPRKLVLEHPLFDIEQCPAENVRIYWVPGLRLYDEQQEKAHGPVIDLVRSLPGVAQVTFKDCHTFAVRRSLAATWHLTEPRIVNLLAGVAACTDDYAEDRPIEGALATPLRGTHQQLSK